MSYFQNNVEGDIDELYLNDYSVIDQYVKTGSLWLSGGGGYYEIGDNQNTSRYSPVQTISGGTNWKSSSGWRTTTGVKTDGTLWLWGMGNYGQIGNNVVANQSSPVQTISSGTNWSVSAAGGNHVASIKTDGTLWLWGRNNYGQLGDNTTVNKSSPVQTVSGTKNWKSVACGDSHNASVKTDGTLWLWGNNAYGQLGDNTVTYKSSPVQTVAGGNNWKMISCGGSITSGVKTDGTLWSWGRNDVGSLGDNTPDHKSSPVQTVAGGTNWKQVSCGQVHILAIKTDGTLWNWGYNQYGQLGDNTVTHKSSPVQTVAGGTNWKTVSYPYVGFVHSSAIKTDGTLWTWGYNSYGMLGDNTTAHKSSPVQTVAGGTNWKSTGNGFWNLMAIYFYDASNLYAQNIVN